jgi:hypothetical protein
MGRSAMERKNRLKFTRLWTSLGLILVGAVIYLSLAHFLPPENFTFPESDKTLHFCAYAVMMFWFGQIYQGKVGSFVIAPCLILLGSLLEFFQGMTDYRTFEYSDMAANAVGVLFGLFISHTRLGRLFFLCEQVLSGPNGKSER